METLVLNLIVTPLALAIQGVSLWAGPVRHPRRERRGAF
jgi:hypothetical protein